jgi:hypothetical protein
MKFFVTAFHLVILLLCSRSQQTYAQERKPDHVSSKSISAAEINELRLNSRNSTFSAFSLADSFSKAGNSLNASQRLSLREMIRNRFFKEELLYAAFYLSAIFLKSCNWSRNCFCPAFAISFTNILLKKPFTFVTLLITSTSV